MKVTLVDFAEAVPSGCAAKMLADLGGEFGDPSILGQASMGRAAANQVIGELATERCLYSMRKIAKAVFRLRRIQ